MSQNEASENSNEDHRTNNRRSLHSSIRPPSLRQRPPAGQSPLDYLHHNDEPKIFVRKSLVELTGNAVQAILLAKILYWLSPAESGERLGKPRSGVVVKEGDAPSFGNFDPRYGLPKTHASFAAETGLSISQVHGGLAALRTVGLIDVGKRTLAGEYAPFVKPKFHLFDDHCNRPSEDHGRPTGVIVYANTVRMVGSANTALVLSQICYLLGEDENQKGHARLGVQKNGEWWLARQYSELAEETGLTERSVRSAVDWLVSVELLKKEKFRFNCQPTVHVRFNLNRFMDLWDEKADAWCSSTNDDVNN